MEQRNTYGLGKPPEGVIRGESVPTGSEPDEIDEAKVQETVGLLKGRGEPYTLMSEFELRKKAKEVLKKNGGI